MLTVAQKAFVDAKLAGMNGLEAARRAGYKGNDATLKVRAAKLMKHPAVAAAIEAGRGAAAAKIEEQAAADPSIAGPLEQQRILTAIARSKSKRISAEARIKAIAQLARIQAPSAPKAGGGGAANANAQVIVVVDNGRGPMRDG